MGFNQCECCHLVFAEFLTAAFQAWLGLAFTVSGDLQCHPTIFAFKAFARFWLFHFYAPLNETELVVIESGCNSNAKELRSVYCEVFPYV
jgi:hypothetical protein